MTAKELKKRYLDFFVKKGHKILPNVSLIPENDPTALFISAGMHPLIPYLLGEPHPLGKRLVSNQRCLRTVDIEKVGNTTHLTFFEMLGNWSLGDPASPNGIGQGGYWKKEAIEWSWEFLTKKLGLDPKRISVSVFAGDRDVPRDEEAAKIWRSLGIPSERIYFFPKKNNWWGPVGESGPCGPDTEMFYDVTGNPHGPGCKPEDGCGRFFEIWNDVFMEYNKTSQGKYEPLKQRNVDTGMGVERTVAVLAGLDDNYQAELFRPIIQSIEVLSGKSYKDEKNKKPMRIIADHLRAATFLISDGVIPSNVEQGYVLRRLIRRAIRFGRTLHLIKVFTPEVAGAVIETMKDEYPVLENSRKEILETLTNEEEKFREALEKGLKEIEKYKTLDGKIAFYLYETYGFPLEMIQEIAQERGQKVKKEVFEKEFKKHQEISRAGAEKKFAGGLADHSEEVTKLHTATHLLHTALRQVLGSHIFQKGSNITAERLRFDFPNPEKLTKEQLKNTEKLVNEIIEKNLPITLEIMDFNKARKEGALTVPGEKYPEKVKVYSIGKFSKEICGGPHVNFTGKLGKFKIIREEGAGTGIRRIYAKLE